jgi:nucleotide-binding universal stress UspA family protein
MASAEKPTSIGMKKILVAIDFSEISLRALAYAAALARALGATVYGAHVIPAEAYRFARPESVNLILQQCGQFAKERIGSMFAQVGVPADDHHILVRDGDVCSVIAGLVTEHHIDHLVLGTTGRKGFRKVLLGSVAEELIRLSPCPVLSIGPDVAEEPPAVLATVLCGIDFSSESLEAAPHAFWLARTLSAKLIVLHVAREPQESPALTQRLLTARLQEQIWPDVGPAKPDFVVRFGDSATEILKLADERNAGLIVIGVRGAGAFTRARTHFGSTAHDVVSQARCPVLTVRELDEADR